jgi:small subunit ribosomal protein S20
MPIKKSAQKELRKSKKNQIYNKKVVDHLKNIIKKSQKAISQKENKAEELVQGALKALDKAAQKGIIKKNTRDRKKSRLQKKLNQIKK